MFQTRMVIEWSFCRRKTAANTKLLLQNVVFYCAGGSGLQISNGIDAATGALGQYPNICTASQIRLEIIPSRSCIGRRFFSRAHAPLAPSISRRLLMQALIGANLVLLFEGDSLITTASHQIRMTAASPLTIQLFRKRSQRER